MADWSDLKYVLAVLREGSTLGASRALHVSQTTVMRRVAAIEGSLGLELFEKRRTGYFPTPALARLTESLNAVEAAHLAFERELGLLGRGLSGTVRLTAPEMLVSHFMRDTLSQFRQHYPSIRIELLTSDQPLDLTGGEADVALRAGNRPSEPTLFGRRIVAQDSWSVCCSKQYARTSGRPGSLADIGNHAFIGVIDGVFTTPVAEWIATNIPNENIAFRQNSVSSIYANIKAGLGISACPDIVAMHDPDIERCFGIDIDTGREIWLLAPERHRNSPHVRILLDFLSTNLTTAARIGVAAVNRESETLELKGPED